MKTINQLSQYIYSLSKKEFQQYLAAILIAISLLASGTTYYIYHVSSGLTQQIRQLNSNANKIARILATNKQLQAKEQKIRELLDKHPDFSMNSYFERFYTKHSLTPEQNWRPEEGAIIEGSEEGIRFQEIILRATFKNQTMQKLITLLQDIYKEAIIYLKGLEITQEGSKINFELTLATKQYQKETEETEE